MWDGYRFAAVAFCVGPVPVCGCRIICGNGTGLRLSHSMWDRHRFAAVAFCVEPIPVCGCRILCGNGTGLRLSQSVGTLPIYGCHILCGTDTGLRLSHSVWDRYRFAAVAFYVGPVPVCGCHSLCGCMGIHRFGDPEQVDRISDSVSYIFLYLCSLFIVSSGLPVCRTVKLYFHRAQMRLIQVVSGAKFTPPPPRKYSWYSFLLHKTCAVRRCFLQVILILRCKNSSTW